MGCHDSKLAVLCLRGVPSAPAEVTRVGELYIAGISDGQVTFLCYSAQTCTIRIRGEDLSASPRGLFC